MRDLKTLIAKVKQQEVAMLEEARRTKIGRQKTQDIMFSWDPRVLFALYFQMKMHASTLSKNAGKVISEEHKIMRELQTILKNPTRNKTSKWENIKEANPIPIITLVKTTALPPILITFLNASNTLFFQSGICLSIPSI